MDPSERAWIEFGAARLIWWVCRRDPVQRGAVHRGDRGRGGQERQAAQAQALLHRQQRHWGLRGLQDRLPLRQEARLHQRPGRDRQGSLLKLPMCVTLSQPHSLLSL